jgi:hypothetical protein
MAEVRIFNPSSYTPRSHFAGEGLERRVTVMAKHYRKRHHHHHGHRRNPFGISSGVVQDAGYNAAGALGSLYLSGLLSTFSGWAGVAATGGAAIGMGFVGKMIGGAKASEELLKGGLTATIIKALHQLGVASNLGLGLYAPSWFGIPTSSSQYLQAAAGNMGPYNRGQGTIFFPGPGGQPQLALPAGVHPAAAAAAGMKGLGFHRFRSRYAGNY